jgi:glycosyltransferase involved in cell wall biosynthesis
LHDNGIWLPHNHRLASLAARRNLVRVVSTRGMLEPWAISHKKLKKQLAWWLYQRRDLRRASFHHTTAPAEAQNLRRLKLGVPVGVIPNGVDEAHVDHSQRHRSETRTALFLGRLHPVKGLSLLLDAWARLRPAGWQLQIAGPDEIGYRAALEDKITAASLSGAVQFLGSLDGAAKQHAFLEADLFVLPSLSESFGMAIGEALAHGLPVLTTTGAPWPMIAQRGCGWSVAPTVDGIADGLRHATALDSAKLAAMGESGRELVRSDFAWPNVAKQFITTYESLLMGESSM